MSGILGWPSSWWCSKIEGVLQVDPGLIFRTPPGVKVLLTSPFNRPASTHWTQSGVLDSDWFVVPSTVNLQIWSAGQPFRLSRDEPIAQLVLLNESLMNEQGFEQQPLSAEPAAHDQWLRYIEHVYGALDTWHGVLPPRRPGVYANMRKRTLIEHRSEPI
jgi:hypothetical protein